MGCYLHPDACSYAPELLDGADGERRWHRHDGSVLAAACRAEASPGEPPALDLGPGARVTLPLERALSDYHPDTNPVALARRATARRRTLRSWNAT